MTTIQTRPGKKASEIRRRDLRWCDGQVNGLSGEGFGMIPQSSLVPDSCLSSSDRASPRSLHRFCYTDDPVKLLPGQTWTTGRSCCGLLERTS